MILLDPHCGQDSPIICLFFIYLRNNLPNTALTSTTQPSLDNWSTRYSIGTPCLRDMDIILVVHAPSSLLEVPITSLTNTLLVKSNKLYSPPFIFTIFPSLYFGDILKFSDNPINNSYGSLCNKPIITVHLTPLTVA